jgi:hypothetical protein
MHAFSGQGAQLPDWEESQVDTTGRHILGLQSTCSTRKCLKQTRIVVDKLLATKGYKDRVQSIRQLLNSCQSVAKKTLENIRSTYANGLKRKA